MMLNKAKLGTFWVFVLVLACSWGCKDGLLNPKGAQNTNTPPTTRIFLDSVALSGENRLRSVVQLHWFGEDKDGVVVGFEVSVDGEQTWAFTNRNDSTFRFAFSGGTDTVDIHFAVRAIDNTGQKDPNPARLRIPIRNTPPTVSFNEDLASSDTVLCVFSIGFTQADEDGTETIDSILIKLNEGTWVRIPTFVNYLTIVPQNPEADGVSSARLLYGLDGRELNLTINGLVLNAPNQLFIKVIDQAGAVSATDTSKQFYVKKKTASLLVFDGWQSFPVANEVYAPLLTQHFGGYNRLDISLNTTFPVSQANLRALIGLYPQVFWYAEETNRQLTYLESAVSVLESYLQTGGKLLLSYPISPNLDPTSEILRLSPIDSVSSVFKDGFVETDGRLLPDSRFANTYTALQNNSGGFVSIVPFYPKAGAEPMFQAELVRGSGQPWPEQPRVTIARIKTANNRTNLIFSTAPLHLFNNGTALSQFMAQVSAEFRP